MGDTLRVLIVGDAIGRPGREMVAKIVPAWKESGRADFVIVNGENSAHGKGITKECARELFEAGADVLTGGNHIWDNKDVFNFIEQEPRLLRPANFGDPPTIPGRGAGVFEVSNRPGVRVGVVNLMGQVHMAPLPSPFHTINRVLEQLAEETKIVFVDFHAEVTSEKIAMGWHLDGRVSCIFGTHTHVPTADNRILPNGTAYMTDIGMTGGYEGVIGVTLEPVLRKFLIHLPVRHEVAAGDVHLSGALVTVDIETGRALNIERVFEPAWGETL